MTAYNVTSNTHKQKVIMVALIAISFLVALSAIPAGLAFAIKPDGSLMQMDASIYKLPLFTDFLIPGLVLLVIIGGGHLASALLLLRKAQKSLNLALMMSVILQSWIGIQVLLIGFTNWLQPFIFLLGLMEMLLTFALLRRRGV